MAVVPEANGKWAVTHYETVQRFINASVVDFRLETGRTHQIRVHAQHRNHPVIGDPKYGGQAIRYGPQSEAQRSRFNRILEILSHPALHAYRLGFRHPITDERLTFEVDPPSDWEPVLELLQSESA
jgi:23S rRNA pseudouridine1911/1915/1917 synthase